MKYFNVDVDITMSCRIEVEAESEEQAKTIVGNWIGDDPMYYLRDGHYISHEFEAVNEGENDNENENPVLREAIKYVRENMDDCDLAILKAKVDKNFTQHMNPAYGIDDGKIIDLLEEYGQDNDLPEEWWEKYGDIDDILVKI